MRNMIRNAGAHLMFLPPYGPDLNPIEQAFAKIKHLMRRAMERTVEAAQDRLRSGRLAAQEAGATRRCSPRQARQRPRHHPAKRMRKLLQRGRICGNLNATCSIWFERDAELTVAALDAAAITRA